MKLRYNSAIVTVSAGGGQARHRPQPDDASPSLKAAMVAARDDRGRAVSHGCAASIPLWHEPYCQDIPSPFAPWRPRLDGRRLVHGNGSAPFSKHEISDETNRHAPQPRPESVA